LNFELVVAALTGAHRGSKHHWS